MKRILSIILISVILLNSSGCATPGLTPLQRRVLESKELEGTFDDAFKAMVSVLQDKGYEIKSSDITAGLIYAELDTQVQARPAWGWCLLYIPGPIIWLILKCGKVNYRYKATINFEKITENRVKMRLSLSGIFDNRLTELVENPRIYQDFYAEIQKEMFRRAQLNK